MFFEHFIFLGGVVISRKVFENEVVSFAASGSLLFSGESCLFCRTEVLVCLVVPFPLLRARKLCNVMFPIAPSYILQTLCRYQIHKRLHETHVFSTSRCSIFRFSAAAISLTSALVALCAA